MIRENWKTVIHSEENMRDAMNHLVDDYLKLVEFWREHESDVDDATWVHVDAVKEEREELESKIQYLELALDNINNEYLDLHAKYKQLLKENKALREGEKPKKKLVKPRKLTIPVEDDIDDLPF